MKTKLVTFQFLSLPLMLVLSLLSTFPLLKAQRHSVDCAQQLTNAGTLFELPLNSPISSREYHSIMFRRPVVEYVAKSGWSLIYDNQECNLLCFMDYTKAETIDSVIYVKPALPNWTMDQAQSNALHVLQLAFPNEDVKSRPIKAYWKENKLKGGFGLGNWNVYLQRIDPDTGLSFRDEYILASISEMHGLFLFKRKEIALPPRRKGPIPSRSRWDEEAEHGAKRIMKWKVVAPLFQGGVISRQSEPVLMIVCPNLVTISNDIHEQPKSRESRVAWQYSFEWRSNTSTSVRETGGLIVWIEAYTGEFLGGDMY